jgi:hypothetical protein
VLATDGRSLSRDALADRMREDGYGVSNARACLLVRILRAEETAVTALTWETSEPVEAPDTAAA